MTASTLLDIRNLRIDAASRTNPTLIVDDVSLEVCRGKVLGLIGESGAGKSTIGLAALGYLRPGTRLLSGSVTFDGVDLFTRTEAQRRLFRGRRIAYVAQSAAAAFNPAFRLIDQLVEASLRERRPNNVRHRAGNGLARSSRPEREDNCDALSSRSVGRTVAARHDRNGLCGRPDLIIFDEPTTALDIATQRDVFTAIRKAIAVEATAAIYISHDLPLVADIADDIHVLRNGRSVERGPAVTIMRDPAQPYTKALTSAGI
uniref:OphD n=1 Tax=Agrobacterium tumefaciens TaxID=358 RepID=Q84HQ8_AGRTU|nr:OphD [Agrobacterium tumefaciens]